jgi:predicted acylesterase/phospholipase RssA
MKAANNIRLTLQRLMMPLQWLFIRLPRPFSFPLLVLFVLQFLYFPELVNISVTLIDWVHAEVEKRIINTFSSPDGFTLFISWAAQVLWNATTLIVSALMTLLLALTGILLSYWLASHFYSFYRRVTFKKIEPPQPMSPQPGGNGNHQDDPLAQYKRIGIILSGGGAKGAYQAGAMQAIYEFLEEHDAHRNVQMIAATSIGSWNALFWLADLIKSTKTGRGPLQDWWSKVNMQKIILPITYLPTRQNYLLSNQPWRDDFNRIFRGTEAGKRLLYHAENPNAKDALRFYFTHSNIGKASLAFTTNRESWDDVKANLPNRRSRAVVDPNTYRAVQDANELRTLENISRGAFSSMDIPPLFPYTPIDDDFFEDGGVIDNLPIRFGTEVEECDLLFILPLNASFERKVDQRSVIRRLARVTEIRQGVLERNSFKMIYLYNELASLRERINELENGGLSDHAEQKADRTSAKPQIHDKIADRALKRTNKVVHVFSICPAPELRIGTTEFWKTKEAGEAFRFMYEVTRNELKHFTKVVNSNQIRMALVSPAGNGNSGNSEENLAAESPFDSAKPIRKETGAVKYDVTYFRDF